MKNTKFIALFLIAAMLVGATLGASANAANVNLLTEADFTALLIEGVTDGITSQTSTTGNTDGNPHAIPTAQGNGIRVTLQERPLNDGQGVGTLFRVFFDELEINLTQTPYLIFNITGDVPNLIFAFNQPTELRSNDSGNEVSMGIGSDALVGGGRKAINVNDLITGNTLTLEEVRFWVNPDGTNAHAGRQFTIEYFYFAATADATPPTDTPPADNGTPPPTTTPPVGAGTGTPAPGQGNPKTFDGGAAMIVVTGLAGLAGAGALVVPKLVKKEEK
ncbi:MAG: hypothetical protein FWE06_03800 [Oscillospiraceae bacterium]|nr:hypothetical protein [Oscillospiraceae bacterium]